MKLLTKVLAKKLPDLYTTETVPDEERKIPIKFYAPWGNWTWYVLEGSPALNGRRNTSGDWLFYGMIDGFEREFEFFTLSELEMVDGPFGLKIQRDKYWDPETTLADVKAMFERWKTGRPGSVDKDAKAT
jgi:hypothetical protein